MKTRTVLLDSGDLDEFCSFDLAGSSLTPEAIARHRPDASMMLVDDRDERRARCSLWWSEAPQLPDERVGAIGHYAAVDDAAGAELLARACERLASEGCTLAVGPMDGNTWRRYRLVTERGDAPPFFLEPDNPDTWPGHFRAAGFSTLASYSSAMTDRLEDRDPRVDRAAERLVDQGVTIRPLELDDFDGELRRIYEVARPAFERNFLYTPIDEDEFVEQYRPAKPYVRPELVLIAEAEGRPVGFLFALPDMQQATRGEPVDTVIVKTVAVLPGRRVAGLGNVLVARVHEVAARMGLRRAIHALMHDANNSRNLSARYSRPLRGYELFARRIG